jgi:citronellol/citronellal dehydrogenase
MDGQLQAVTIPLRGRTAFITGASRGIGKAIALRLAADGANVVVTGKTVEPHRTLPGTIYTAAEEIRGAGGSAIAIPMDVRDEAQVETAVNRAIGEFGRIDILVNNASAISLTGTATTPMKRFDLMYQVNVRGTFLCTQKCLPHLKRAIGAHVLNIAPPLNFAPRWFAPHAAYSISKYGMSLCVLGMAEEFRAEGIAVNALWPRTIIDTAALALVPGVERSRGRTPAIVADAAFEILTWDPGTCTGRFFVDEDVLREAGVSDFSRYRTDSSSHEELLDDLFL